MTDVTIADAGGDAPVKLVEVMITKAKKALGVDTSALSDEVFAEIIYRGLSDLLTSGMSKITVKDLEGEELEKAKAAAFEKAEENLKVLLSGKVKHKGQRGSGASATKHSREVTTEAMRLGRDVIKDQIRADGGKPSHYKASDISKWAKELLEADPSYYEMAAANIEGRKQKKLGISLEGLKPDETLVAKAEAKAKATKPKAAGQLSAKQAGKAGKVAPPRQKPGTQPTVN